MRHRITAGLRMQAPVPELAGAARNGDFRLNTDWAVESDKPIRHAAVLVPLVEHGDGISVLLTERATHLSNHAGQVAFPGGSIDPEDDGPLAAALREAWEEVGLEPDFVEPVGYLDPYETGTRFRIVPVVGFVKPGFALTINRDEVDEAFEVPLSFLMDPANHEQHSASWQGKRRTYFAMPYEGHYIWGATAGIIVNFYERVFAR